MPAQLKRLSLKHTFLWVGILPLCLCCMIMFAGFIYIQHRQATETQEQYLATLSNIFEHHKTRQLAPDILLDELAPTLLQWPALHHLSVLTADGATRHDAGLPLPFQQLSWLNSESIGYFEQSRKAFVVYPYTYQKEPLWLVAGFDLTGMRWPLYQLLLWALGGLTGLGALILIGHSALFNKVQRPVQEIIHELDYILRNQADEPLAIRHAFPFNHLVQKINGLMSRQNHLKEDLQQHITQATQELRETLETVEIQNIELDIARKNALQNNHIKSEFLANTSHELRTPLNSILGFTSLLGKTELEAEQTDYLHTIEQSAQSLLSTINDILDFSKLETGDMVLEHKIFDVQTIVGQIVQGNTHAAQEKNMRLLTEIDERIATRFVGDAKRIGQVLHKLISNALKFSRSDEVIVKAFIVNTENAETTLRFNVEDHGIGLNKAQQAHLFAPFTQADGGDTREHGGTGLGLAIAKSLVQRMQGKIGVDSQPNQGATFWFMLPVAVVNDRSAQLDWEKGASNEASTTKQITMQDLSVLGVDDNEANLKLLGEFLRGLGLQPKLVNNGREAVALANNHPFDLILMDVQMPEMNGMQAAQEIRQQETSKRTPIIALTAHIEPENRTELLLAGMDDFMSKPVTEEDLQHLLERWVLLGVDVQVSGNAQPQNTLATTGHADSEICRGSLSDADKMFDLSETFRLTKDSPALAFEMFEMLMDSVAETKQLSQRLFDQGDLEALRDLVHRFYGGCCYCGVPRLRKISRDTEKAIGSGSREAIGAVLSTLISEMEQLEAWVAEYDIKTLFGLDTLEK